MNLAIVDRVKNLKNVVEHYNANPKIIIKNKIAITKNKIFFFELNIS